MCCAAVVLRAMGVVIYCRLDFVSLLPRSKRNCVWYGWSFCFSMSCLFTTCLFLFLFITQNFRNNQGIVLLLNGENLDPEAYQGKNTVGAIVGSAPKRPSQFKLRVQKMSVIESGKRIFGTQGPIFSSPAAHVRYTRSFHHSTPRTTRLLEHATAEKSRDAEQNHDRQPTFF